MMTSLPPDPTLDEIRDALASDIAGNAAFDGWGDDAIIAAANGAGVDIDVARLAFPGGAPDMIDAWFAPVDRARSDEHPSALQSLMRITYAVFCLKKSTV